MTNQKAIWQMIDEDDMAGLTAKTAQLNADLNARIEASRIKIHVEEVAAGSGPIVESEWLGGTRYRIANVRHGVIPAQQEFDSYDAMIIAFRTANK